ncbi:heavy-metal-associated domain-containing protein [Blastococcus sp. TML/M2B]|uniref:Heavy-metal-associated domain-containing protein n=1 Tax=Blastococcus saxobsidens TaxID=138336 RepID=A0A6L9W747_9ACTN|nr:MULTISPECIES: heavy-metal-associated domain-containing protein [unclassified Blastococcus]MBN1092183.1 heavy-metal-associated domain-containing protein [Blastococcus sp. TML/M2B]MBN1097712.1 heavy-metal-associated domain-containing protein [Blastococcus sp. TML/C7B]NEK87867.1 heavy-metal-associated domain-containing protein [Blastococcus saxobsidens]
MSTATYSVVGMTCGHCVNSVAEEVRQVPGVTDVSVDLATGGLTVSAVADVDDGAVRTAVEEAGYQVAEPVNLLAGAGEQTSGCGCGCS